MVETNETPAVVAGGHVTVWNSFRSRFIMTRASGFSADMPEGWVGVCVWVGMGEGRSHGLRGGDTGVHEAQRDGDLIRPYTCCDLQEA